MATPTGLTSNGKPITLEALHAAVKVCFLCGAPPTYFGIFIPNDQKRAIEVTGGVAPRHEHQARSIAYGICDECVKMGKDAIFTAVEAKILGVAS